MSGWVDGWMGGWSLSTFPSSLPAAVLLEVGPLSTIDSATPTRWSFTSDTKKGESVLSEGSSGASVGAGSVFLHSFGQGRGSGQNYF